MNHRRTLLLLALAGSLTLARPTAAHDKDALYARDVVHCMQGRMRGNQAESYRDAFKACKQQLDPYSSGHATATAMNTAKVSEPPKP